MNTLIIVLMCYLHQPVAFFMDSPNEEALLVPFISAPISDEAKEAAIGLCRDEDAITKDGFYIWHLDKLNKHKFIRG